MQVFCSQTKDQKQNSNLRITLFILLLFDIVYKDLHCNQMT